MLWQQMRQFAGQRLLEIYPLFYELGNIAIYFTVLAVATGRAQITKKREKCDICLAVQAATLLHD